MTEYCSGTDCQAVHLRHSHPNDHITLFVIVIYFTRYLKLHGTVLYDIAWTFYANVLSYSAICCITMHIRKCVRFLQNEDWSEQCTHMSYLDSSFFVFIPTNPRKLNLINLIKNLPLVLLNLWGRWSHSDHMDNFSQHSSTTHQQGDRRVFPFSQIACVSFQSSPEVIA